MTAAEHAQRASELAELASHQFDPFDGRSSVARRSLAAATSQAHSLAAIALMSVDGTFFVATSKGERV